MKSKAWPKAYQPGCCCYCSPRRIGSPNQVAFCSAARRRIFGSERHAQITVFACVFAICVSSLVITNFSGAAPSCSAKAAIMPKVHFCRITTTRKADVEAAPSQSWECNNKDGGALRCYRHQKHQLVNIIYRMHYLSIFIIRKISLLTFAGPLLDLYPYILTKPPTILVKLLCNCSVSWTTHKSPPRVLSISTTSLLITINNVLKIQINIVISQ